VSEVEGRVKISRSVAVESSIAMSNEPRDKLEDELISALCHMVRMSSQDSSCGLNHFKMAGQRGEIVQLLNYFVRRQRARW
jgi:hypothetical protein